MKRTRLFDSAVVVTAGLVVVLAAAPRAANAGDRKWQLRVAGLSVDSGRPYVDVSPGDGVSIGTNLGVGIGVDLEYRLSRRLGVDFGVLSAATGFGTSLNIDWTGVILRSGITMTPVTAGLNVHLTPDSRFDLYAGPMVAYVMYSGFSLDIGSLFEAGYRSESDFGFGANLGVDLKLGKGRWSLNANIRHLATTLEVRPSGSRYTKGIVAGTATTSLDPTIFSLGVGFRF